METKKIFYKLNAELLSSNNLSFAERCFIAYVQSYLDSKMEFYASDENIGMALNVGKSYVGKLVKSLINKKIFLVVNKKYVDTFTNKWVNKRLIDINYPELELLYQVNQPQISIPILPEVKDEVIMLTSTIEQPIEVIPQPEPILPVIQDIDDVEVIDEAKQNLIEAIQFEIEMEIPSIPKATAKLAAQKIVNENFDEALKQDAYDKLRAKYQPKVNLIDERLNQFKFHHEKASFTLFINHVKENIPTLTDEELLNEFDNASTLKLSAAQVIYNYKKTHNLEQTK